MRSITQVHLFRVRCSKAVSASLIGEFNGWSTTATPMERNGDEWEVRLDLPVGQTECAVFLLLPLPCDDEGSLRFVGVIRQADQADIGSSWHPCDRGICES
jgi:hypothetical protein